MSSPSSDRRRLSLYRQRSVFLQCGMLFNPLSTLQSLFGALQGSDDPSHVAAGFALGAALGLVPKGNLFGLLFILLFFFFRVDKGMAIVTAAIFTPIGYAIDPLAHHVGLALLT